MTAVGLVLDRYLAFSKREQAVEVNAEAFEADELEALAAESVDAALDAGDGEGALRAISSVSSVIDAGGDAAANTDLVSGLMASTLSAFGNVGVETSSEATSQLLGRRPTPGTSSPASRRPSPPRGTSSGPCGASTSSCRSRTSRT